MVSTGIASSPFTPDSCGTAAIRPNPGHLLCRTILAFQRRRRDSESAREARKNSRPPARDHVGFVEEPQAAALAQNRAGGVDIAAVGDHLAEPVVLHLR